MHSPFSLDGKVALVTGGARHLGHRIACGLAAAGANVIVTSRSLTTARNAARSLEREYGATAFGLALDQRDHRSVARAIEAARKWKKRIDILVNNAGGTPGHGPRQLLERSPADVEDLIQTNLVGMLYCCQEVARGMVRQKRGKIVNIASIAGLVGRDRRLYARSRMSGQPVDYAAAKAGVIGMTRDLAGVLSPKGINVNCVSPGGFARDTLPARFVRDYSDRTPMGRMGREESDIAGAVVFLCAAASDYITGHNLVVDGGFSIWR
jgi:gluconate 5-dehydrogenase